jgi:hypothetical protein
VRSRALRRLIPAHRFVQQVGVHLGSEHGVGKVDLPDVLAFQILDVHYRHRRRVLGLSLQTSTEIPYFDLRTLRIKQ